MIELYVAIVLSIITVMFILICPPVSMFTACMIVMMLHIMRSEK